MLQTATSSAIADARPIVATTRGHRHGPVTRLFSPGDLGEVLKPFVFLDVIDAQIADGAGFGRHPHSGIITVTTLFDGAIGYEDSTGKSGVLPAGGVEWMRAGSGVWHYAAAVGGGRSYGYQLWLALPEAIENDGPESRYIAPGQIATIGNVRVILGEYGGVRSPLPQVSPLTYLHVRLADGEHWTFDPPAGHDVLWIAVDRGAVAVSGRTVAGEVAVFAEGAGPLTLRAEGEVNLMLGSAVRHPHPLVTGYYSVHTNPAALAIGEQGIRDVGARINAAVAG